MGGSISSCQATVGVGMKTPLLTSPLSAPIFGAIKKKRVLLIDTSHAKLSKNEPLSRRCRSQENKAFCPEETRSRTGHVDLVFSGCNSMPLFITILLEKKPRFCRARKSSHLSRSGPNLRKSSR